MEKIVFEKHWRLLEEAVSNLNGEISILRDCGMEFVGSLHTWELGDLEVSNLHLSELTRFTVNLRRDSVKKKVVLDNEATD